MIGRHRCRSCGYYHVGPAPERCPVCGAPKTSFVPYEGPGDLRDTETFGNLAAAFAGESQANRRYALWARIAELEGDAEATAAFEHAAEEETAHALGHLAYMGAFGETPDNLRAAMTGEAYETADMYPRFAEVAEREGFPEIAYFFRSVGRFEDEHRGRYEAALGDAKPPE